jgi:glycosyltransferase involved in cell wall biosynthesis
MTVPKSGKKILFLAPSVTSSNISRPMAFASLLSGENEVELWGPAEEGRPLYRTNESVRIRPLSGLTPVDALRAILGALHFDVIVACDSRMYSAVAGTVSKFALRRRYVFDTGDDELAMVRFEGKRIRALVPWFSFMLSKLADQVVVASTHLAKRYGGRVLPVPFRRGSPQEVPRTALGESGTTIMFVGVIRRHKGIDTLVASFRYIQREVPDSRLVLVGDTSTGLFPGEMVRLAREISSRIVFTGHVPSSDIPSYMSSADVLVLPNPDNPIHRFQVPIKLIEYMSSGKPIVATRVGDVSTILTDRVTGVLINPGLPREMASSIVSILKDPKTGEKIGKRAKRSFLGRYSYQAASKKIGILFLGDEE